MRRRRILATLYALTLGVLGLSVAAPPVAHAAACSFPTPSPLPSADNLIETAADLQWLRSNTSQWTSGKTWTQTTDIDMGGCVWQGAGFRHSLTLATTFAATYDGGGFSITGVNIELPQNQQNGGLFGKVTGTVKNLRYSGNVLPEAGKNGQARVGGMVGWLNGGTLENVRFAGTVQGESYVGGLVGEIDAGGSISRSFSTGNVSSHGVNPTYFGGLVGYGAVMDIDNSFSTSQVTGPSWRGGLVGAYVGSSNTLEKSYFSGAVIASGSSNTIGGVTGANTTTGISNNFWRVDAPGTDATSGNGGSSPSDTGASPKTTAEMQTLSTFQSAGWDITAGWTDPNGGSPVTWGICTQSNDGFPFLNAFYSSDPCTSGGESATTTTQPAYTFSFLTFGGGTCLPTVTVTRFERFTLPPASVACTPLGTSMVGWSIPGQDWAFAPGRVVTVVDSQVFTAMAREPELTIVYDANVNMADPCLVNNLNVEVELDRHETVRVSRTGATLATSAPCAPAGFRLIGWTDANTPDGSGQAQTSAATYQPGTTVPEVWNLDTPNPVNSVRLYALWGRG